MLYNIDEKLLCQLEGACPLSLWRAVLGKKFLFTYKSSYSSIEITHSQETFIGKNLDTFNGGNWVKGKYN